jgi:hypothetical protein
MKALVLYRKRSGGILCGSTVLPIAGAFLIQPLEGSRFGTPPLWDLDVCSGDQRRAIGRFEAEWRADFRPFAEQLAETPRSRR